MASSDILLLGVLLIGGYLAWRSLYKPGEKVDILTPSTQFWLQHADPKTGKLYTPPGKVNKGWSSQDFRLTVA